MLIASSVAFSVYKKQQQSEESNVYHSHICTSRRVNVQTCCKAWYDMTLYQIGETRYKIRHINRQGKKTHVFDTVNYISDFAESGSGNSSSSSSGGGGGGGGGITV